MFGSPVPNLAVTAGGVAPGTYTTAWHYPTNYSESGSDTAFTNPSRIIGSDTGETSSDFGHVDMEDGAYSKKLVVDTLGFTVPTGATVNGVEWNFRCSYEEDRRAFYEMSHVYVMTASGIDGTNHYSTFTSQVKAVGENVLVTATLGGSSDLLGATLSPADCNHNDFGMEIQAYESDARSELATFRVYWCRCRITYTV